MYARALTQGGMPHKVSPGMVDVKQVLEGDAELDRLKAIRGTRK